MLSRLERRVTNTADHNRSSLLTIHELLHILDESVDNSERVSCSGLGLVLRQSVKSLEDYLDVFLLEESLYKLDCVVLSKRKMSARTDSLDRRCLSSSVTRASIQINSIKILTTISSIAGAGDIRV